MTGFRLNSPAWMELFTRYRCVFWSKRRPNASSNNEQAASGSQMSGTEESINDSMLDGRSEVSLFVDNVLVVLID